MIFAIKILLSIITSYLFLRCILMQPPIFELARQGRLETDGLDLLTEYIDKSTAAGFLLLSIKVLSGL